MANLHHHRFALSTEILFFVIVLFSVIYPIVAKASPNIPMYDWKSDYIKKILKTCQLQQNSGTMPIREDIVIKYLREADHTGCISPETPLNQALKDTITIMEKLDQKPLLTSYRFRTQLADRDISLDNMYGETTNKGLTTTFDMRLRGVLPFGFSYDLTPSIRISQLVYQNHSSGKLFTGYIKWTYRNLELEAGRDSLWWGPTYHGNSIITNNIPPFDLIKVSNVEPFDLPWVLKYLGDINMIIFYTKTSTQDINYIHRGEPKVKVEQPNFLGTRVEIRPLSFFHFGASLASQFTGMENTLTWNDWKQILLPTWGANEEEDTEGPIVNRRYSYDFVIHTTKIPKIPYSELYWEYGGEVGFVSSFLRIPFPKPQFVDDVVGTYLDFGNIDIRAEVSFPFDVGTTKTYSHYQFTEGYRHEGRIIGHHIGPWATDYFIRTTYLTSSSSSLGLDIDYEDHYREDWSRTIIGTDVNLRQNKDWNYQLRYEWHGGSQSLKTQQSNYLAFTIFYLF